MPDARHVLGVDVGGTKILAGVVDTDGKVVCEREAPCGAERGQDAVIRTMVEVSKAVLRDAGLGPGGVLGAGISAAGFCDTRAGVMLLSPNLPGWRNVPLARRMSEGLGLPVVLGNDANVAALAEHAFGAGRGVDEMVYMTVSTGIGGGLVLGGKMYEGVSGTAGEIGHVVVEVNGRQCGCGQRGCLETLSAGWALAAQGRELARSGRAPKLLSLAGDKPEAITAREVFDAAAAGEASCETVLERGRLGLAMGLVSLVNLVNPAMIVIGGGVARRWDEYIAPAVNIMRERVAIRKSADDLRVVPAKLGKEVAMLGAAALALQEGKS